MSQFHRASEIQQAFGDVEHICFRIPLYSPSLNVVEWAFGHIKSHAQCNELHTLMVM